jgi:hypothetical protein
MADDLQKTLAEFAAANGFRGKGPLSVALVVTQHAKKMGLPLDPARLVTKKEGQVRGLGKSAVQKILNRHGISRVLAAEGGRTSRGSLNNMRDYVAFLNELATHGELDLNAVELFWIEKVNEFFDRKPFGIKMDPSRGLRAVVSDIIAQAEERQKTSSGMHYAGAFLQYLVGAKLDCALGKGRFEHNSFSTADAPAGRAGDFLVGDVAIHVTTAPGEAVIGRCRDNLNDGYRPIVITTRRGVAVAEGLAANLGLGERIDIFEIEQFVALNIYELGKFAADGRKVAVTDLVERYNEIIEDVETDPSMKIEFTRRASSSAKSGTDDDEDFFA